LTGDARWLMKRFEMEKDNRSSVPTRSGLIDQHASHRVGRYSIEMSTVLPLQSGLVCETQIALMNERSGLKGEGSTLPAQSYPGQSQQIFVDNRREPL
jgi:hypothetical protein